MGWREHLPRAKVSAADMRGMRGTIPAGNVSRKPTWHAACISSTTTHLNLTLCVLHVSCLAWPLQSLAW